jgi:hypothetical protein
VEWRIEVPSAGRAATLAAKTLPLLRSAGVPDRDVRVWVPAAERDAYAAAAPEVDLVPLDYVPGSGRIEDGPFAVGLVRNAIIDAAAPGDLVLSVDDDLAGLVEFDGMKDGINARLVDVAGPRLLRIVERGFALAEDAGAYLWGVHPAATYARDRVRLDLCYIGAALFGQRVRGEPEVERVKLDDKEDFERSLRFYERDGRLLRLDGVSWRTRGYGGAGGMQTTRTPERIDASAKWCADRWPQWAALKYPRSGKTELRLADRRRSA